MPKLSDPIKIRGMEIKNRLSFPPYLSFSRTLQGCPTKDTFQIHEQYARGGVGMIIVEATPIEPKMHLSLDSNLPVYKKLTERIHKYNVKFGIQLAEAGSTGFLLLLFFPKIPPVRGPSNVDTIKATSAFNEYLPNWKSMIENSGSGVRGINIEEIQWVEDQFAYSAKRAIEVGFDFIEIHSAHGTLHGSFISRFFNQRTDEYGGSIENITRFTAETIEKVRKAIGEKPPIIVRISADELVNGGINIEDSKLVAQILEKAGADCIDVSQGLQMRSTHGVQIPFYVDQGGFIHLAEAIKKVVDIPVIGVGRIVDPRMADRFIQEGKADIIHMARQLICDPETPNKYFNGQIDDIKFCIGCLQGCNGPPQVCIYDAFSARKYQELVPSTEPKKIVILGAGIAGMEAARVAKLRGHEVEIYEKSDKIGGLLPLVAKEFKKEDYMNIINYLRIQLQKLDVPIHLNHELTKNEIAKIKPDIVLLAVGTKSLIPESFKEKSNVLTQDEAILKSKPIGKKVVVRGLNTYWRGGCETAITLHQQGYDVILIGPEKSIGRTMTGTTGRIYWVCKYLKDNKIPVHMKSKIISVTEKSVTFIDSNKNEHTIDADTLVYCGSRMALGKDLQKEYEGVSPEIVLIGDCKRPRDIQEAMKDAQTFVRNMK